MAKKFEAHMMYSPDGKSAMAATMEDHLRYKEMGWGHEKTSPLNVTPAPAPSRGWAKLAYGASGSGGTQGGGFGNTGYTVDFTNIDFGKAALADQMKQNEKKKFKKDEEGLIQIFGEGNEALGKGFIKDLKLFGEQSMRATTKSYLGKAGLAAAAYAAAIGGLVGTAILSGGAGLIPIAATAAGMIFLPRALQYQSDTAGDAPATARRLASQIDIPQENPVRVPSSAISETVTQQDSGTTLPMYRAATPEANLEFLRQIEREKLLGVRN